MCGRSWDGRFEGGMNIPGELPKPGDAWPERLSDVMGREKLSGNQYVKDSRKYNLRMPYMRVIPDEENHIAWIGGLYQAFKEKYSADVPPVIETDSPEEAYKVSMELEQKLVPEYGRNDGTWNDGVVMNRIRIGLHKDRLPISARLDQMEEL